MGGFLQALSALAPIAPALSDARDLRVARQQQEDQFAEEQKLKEAQLTAQRLAAQGEQQRITQGNQPVTIGEPQWNPTTHSNQILTFDKNTGSFALKDVPGVDPLAAAEARYQAARQSFKTTAGRDLTPAEDQSLFFQSYGLKTPAELTPYQSIEFNQPKLNMTGGVPTVTFQGKDFTAVDLKDPSTPAEVKKLLQNGEDAIAQKEAEETKRQKDAMDRLTASWEHQSEMQTQRVIDALHVSDYQKAQVEVRKAQTSYNFSQNLYARMQAAAQKALADPAHPDQQAMFSVLSNHIVMTTRQPGSSMRPSKPLFDEAVSSLPGSDALTKRFTENGGVLMGVVLTPDQIRQMVDLGQQRVQADQQTLNEVKSSYAQALGWGQSMENGGGTDTGKKGNRATPAAPSTVPAAPGAFDWDNRSVPAPAPGGPQ